MPLSATECYYNLRLWQVEALAFPRAPRIDAKNHLPPCYRIYAIHGEAYSKTASRGESLKGPLSLHHDADDADNEKAFLDWFGTAQKALDQMQEEWLMELRENQSDAKPKDNPDDDYLNAIRLSVLRKDNVKKDMKFTLLLAATSLQHGVLMLWKYEPGLGGWRKRLKVVDPKKPAGASRAPAFDFSRDGEYLAVGWTDCKLHLFDAKEGIELLEFDEAYLPRAVCFIQGAELADPPLLASGGRNGCVTIRAAETGEIVKSVDVEQWVATLATTGTGAILGVGTVGTGVKMVDTIFDPLSERVIAFWAQKDNEATGLPVASNFLTHDVLHHQTSPSGRTLISHAVQANSVDRLELLLKHTPTKTPAFSNLLHRDVEAMHALDYAMRNNDFVSLRLLLDAVIKLPPRARIGLTERYKYIDAKAGIDETTCRDEDGVGLSLRVGEKGLQPCLQPCFLVELAEKFPSLCAKFLQDLDLDEYEPYDGSPRYYPQRYEEKLLESTIEKLDRSKDYVCIKGTDSFAPQSRDLEDPNKSENKTTYCEPRQEERSSWPWTKSSSSEPVLPVEASQQLWPRNKAKAEECVNVEARLVGMPSLSAADAHDPREYTFSRLVRVYSRRKRTRHCAMMSPVMQTVIEYKWQVSIPPIATRLPPDYHRMCQLPLIAIGCYR